MADRKTERNESDFVLGQLAQKLLKDVSRLIRNESQLLKTEFKEDILNLVKGSALLAIGLGSGFLAVSVLTVTLITLLDKRFKNLTWSTFVTATMYLALCLALVSVGKSKASQTVPLLEESRRELQKDQEALERAL